MGDYSTTNMYQGGYSSLNPTYGSVFTGYRVAASELGMTTDPRTANQLQALNQGLNQGAIPIEIGTIQPEHFDQIPKQHFKEMSRIAKLTGAKISLHAPIIGMEPSGMGEQGWSESSRQMVEKQLTAAVEKAVDLDDSGNIPVTMHSTVSAPGTEYEITKEGKKVAKIVLVDRETGKPVQAAEAEKLYYPSEMHKPTPEAQRKIDEGLLSREELTKKDVVPVSLIEGKTYTPEERIENMNNSKWDTEVTQLIFNKERADEILNQNQVQIMDILPQVMNGTLDPSKLGPSQKQALHHLQNAKIYLDDTRQHVEGLFNKAYKYGTEEDKKILGEISENFQKDLGKDPTPMGQSRALHGLMLGLKQGVSPQMFVPAEEFAIEKSSETFANVAFNTYKKFKDKSPIISIENLWPGMAFALKKEGKKGLPGMNELILESRNKFVTKAIESGIGEDEAKKQADRMIGMTLDVGHLNIARKHGFKEEDIRKEVAEIAKHVKHVHLTDNFGHSDSHLPPGMGNVPIKEIFQELEKTGFKGRRILEVGGWFEHFKTSPYAMSLEAMGSPLYSMNMGPYWNQSIGLQQSYSSGYGMMLPQVNYETFGGGFSQLPAELGGQRGGGAGGSRMGGGPME